MPSTVESLGQKLEEARKVTADLTLKNAGLKTKISQLKKRMQSLRAALKGTASQNFQLL
jgi:phage shock protein A